jgi:hypothetical protein
MARNQNNETTAADVNEGLPANAVDGTASVEGAAAVAPAADERYVMIKHDKTGEMVKRQDFIRECWQERRMSRGEIAKLLTEIQGKKVPYQIVFAATKKLEGGPVKQETTAGEAAPATGESAGGESTTIGG